jgi:hypothetical protein
VNSTASFLFDLPIDCIHCTIQSFEGQPTDEPTWTRGGDFETQFCCVDAGFQSASDSHFYSIDHRSFQIAVCSVAVGAASDALQNCQETETSKARQNGVVPLGVV